MTQQAVKRYRPAENELACLDDIKRMEGMELWNLAYPIILKQVTNFDSRATEEDIAKIRRYADKHDVDLIC